MGLFRLSGRHTAGMVQVWQVPDFVGYCSTSHQPDQADSLDPVNRKTLVIEGGAKGRGVNL